MQASTIHFKPACRHQRVWCPRKQILVHLREIPLGGLADGVLVIAALPSKSEADLDFLGPALPDSIAKAIAEGKLPA
jgi:hypothetical protein